MAERFGGERAGSSSSLCRDNFRCRLVKEDDGFRFRSVHLGQAGNCGRKAGPRIADLLEGRLLSEVDVEALESLSCEDCAGNPLEIAELVREWRKQFRG